jgi:3-hydroxyacyl-CoA dehydrogenase
MRDETAGQVTAETRSAVRLIWIDHPPANAIGPALVEGLAAAFGAVAADPGLRAVVLSAKGRVFSAGAGPEGLLRADGQGLGALCRRIETLGRPVVAALQGNALGAGLELALAAHGRIALEEARLGLPEIGLGLSPVSGASQRLPRLVGAEAALRLMLEGRPLTAVEALTIGLVDHVTDAGLIDRAIAFALQLAGAPPVPALERGEGLRDPRAYQSAIAAARRKVAGGRLPAPGRIIDCVEAAQLLPPEAALAYERAAFEDLAASPVAQALIHAFTAERAAQRPPAGLPRPEGRAPATVGLWEAGRQAGLVQALLAAGLRVVLACPDREALAAALERLAARMEEQVAAGHLSPAARDADWGRLSGQTGAAALAGADLVLCGAGEGASLPPGLPPDLPPDLPVAGLGDRSAAVALFLSGDPGGLAEIVLAGPEAAASPAAALLVALVRRLGLRQVFSTAGRRGAGAGGPVGQRLRGALSRLIAHLEAGGLDRGTIAAALASYGIGAAAAAPRLPPPSAAAADVVPAALAVLAAEGLRLCEEGVVARTGDVDAVALLSGLFPRWQGGPMYQAGLQGPMALRADLRRRAETAPDLFAPPPLLDRIIAGEARW